MAHNPTIPNLPPPEERFYANVVKMTSLIREIVVTANQTGYTDVTPIIIDLVTKYLENNFDKKGLIEGFIIHSHPPSNSQDLNSPLDHTTWDKILAKDETFFQEKAFDIFKGLPVNSIEAFRKLYIHRNPQTGKSIISEDNRNAMITFFHSFVKIAIKYIHAMRQPYASTDSEGKKKYYYRNANFMRGINVLDHAKKWGINLEFDVSGAQ